MPERSVSVFDRLRPFYDQKSSESVMKPWTFRKKILTKLKSKTAVSTDIKFQFIQSFEHHQNEYHPFIDKNRQAFKQNHRDQFRLSIYYIGLVF